MDANEFERNKPRLTYAAIQDLKNFVQECAANNVSNRTYDANLFVIKDKLGKIEAHFLLGE